MRVTNQGTAAHLLDYLQTAQARLAETQERVASGRRINRPSDDPFGTSRALAAHTSIDLVAQRQRTVTLARAELGSTEAVLDSVGLVLARAQELAVQADNSAINSAARKQIAAEVEQLIAEMVTLGNNSYGGRRIFAGQQTQTTPFVEDVAGYPGTVTYAGDAGAISREIGDGEQMPVNLRGDQIFLPIFQKLIAFRDALNSNDLPAISLTSGGIGQEMDNVLQARGEIGARMRRLDLTDSRLQEADLQLKTNVSNLEEADITQEAVDLQSRQMALQAALAATGRSLGTSLLDFLR